MKGILALLIAVLGVAFCYNLLTSGDINQGTFLACLGITALSSLAVYLSDRLNVLDFKNLTITLGQFRSTITEAKEERRKIEQAKDELAEMYGEVEKLRREPLKMDSQKLEELGIGSGVVFGNAVMRYTAGVVTRERERLAKLFVEPKEPEALARAILDNSLDDNVFKWVGPESTLDVPPKSTSERKLEKEQPGKQETEKD